MIPTLLWFLALAIIILVAALGLLRGGSDD